MIKKLVMLFLLILGMTTTIPLYANAAVNETELNAFLKELEWTKEQLVSYLDIEWEHTLDDFESVEELRDWLSPVIDEEILQQILDEYGISESYLLQFLKEQNKTLAHFKFYDDLFYYLSDTLEIDEQQLAEFLNELNWTEEDLEEYLATWGMSIYEFSTVGQIKNFLGDLLNEENLDELLSDYGWTRAQLDAQLKADGLTLAEFKFYDDLKEYMYSFLEIDVEELATYLQSIGLTRDEFDNYLWYQYELTVDDFRTLEELQDFLGELLTEENLVNLLDDYEITRDELDELLAEYGFTIEDFIFYDDLDMFLWDVLLQWDWDLEDLLDAETAALFKRIGLETYELENIFIHLFEQLEESPSLWDEVENLYYFLEEYEGVEASDLSIAELIHFAKTAKYYLDVFQFDVSFAIRENGIDTPLSFQNLLTLASLNDDQKLVISLYSKGGSLLADFLFDNELLGLKPPTIEKPDEGKQPSKPKPNHPEVEQPIKDIPLKDHDKQTSTDSENGQTLPNTATENYTFIFIGTALLALGFLLWTFRRIRFTH
ncbi:processed acidic surface protein [Alkalihalobacillus pseudalcaliphilus]|uniref:processed acidic surface protein n=1 Tax=Alkalihalobacillus pseudalcaliphilus TaxID=79884 RepID=UPI00064DD6BA|nr:processed acidic surface protein [Alkalihalobacillus pseudalcaliphilus]KMK78217.1 hypothetical protein AB990_01925 [Alkalihalobacillus pseudalcaliphilus]